ncbi:MAG: hypothetical protein WCA46_14650 [Actinocatenispora sp.]
MYGWIWRKLPFGAPGKILGSLILLGAAFALLWYIVFPALDPILPFNDVQVSGPGGDQPRPKPPTTPPASPAQDDKLPGN